MASVRKDEVSIRMNANKSCNMLIREICGIWSKCSKSFQNVYGISQSQLLYLQCIAEAGERRVYLKELEKSLDIGQASVVRMIDKLEMLGMVEKLQDEKDARKKYTRLTEKGRECCGRAKRIWQETEIGFMSSLTETEIQTLSQLLTRVCADSRDVLLRLEPQDIVGGGKTEL